VNEPEPSTGDEQSAGSALRRGLRPRSKPKQYQAFESEESDGEWSPKRKKGSRKRVRPKKEERQAKTESAPLSSTGLSGRQERPLPPDLDEKQRKRILRNRASAERSRLKRLGQIAMLEQENRELKQQLAEAQQAASGNAGAASQPQNDLLHENSMLR
jgi:acyl-CoA reductase-like NAD-dependent aldehyde dehydrogenase